MPQNFNRIDNLKQQIKGELQGDALTSRTGTYSGLGSAPFSSTRLRWIEDGVVLHAFLWGKHRLDDPNAIFI